MARELIAGVVAAGVAIAAIVAWRQHAPAALQPDAASAEPDAGSTELAVVARQPAAPLASKASYRIDAGAAAPCTAGATCTQKLVLTALAGYHVNEQYPFRFVADPSPAVALTAPATFTRDDASHGTMTLGFLPAAPGTARLAGTFKLSVCSDETCEIEKPQLAIAVAVR